MQNVKKTGSGATPAKPSTLPMGSLWVPSKVTLEEERWLVVPDSARLVEKTAKPGLFDDFIDLADAEPLAVLEFAQSWGLLGVCRHRQPRSHSKACSERERVSDWTKFARECRALLRTADPLLAGEKAPPAIWAESPYPDVSGEGASVANQRVFVEIKMTMLIDAAG